MDIVRPAGATAAAALPVLVFIHGAHARVLSCCFAVLSLPAAVLSSPFSICQLMRLRPLALQVEVSPRAAPAGRAGSHWRQAKA